MGEEVMDRRSFFKFLPVAPVVLAAEGVRAATADQAPTGVVPLQLMAQQKPKQMFGYFMPPETDWSRSVSISVGQDGKLWIKSKNDVWKRVATE
jgi:hypothetical protein